MNNELFEEQKNPYLNMTLEQRNFYLRILANCKEIADTKYPVNNKSRCDIVELKLQKSDNQVKFEGFLNIQNENRCINGYLFVLKNKIIVNMYITRLIDTFEKEYSVIDEFRLENDKLIRSNRYNGQRKDGKTILNNNIMEEKTK